MAYKIIFSDNSLEEMEEIVNNLKYYWGENVALSFKNSIEKLKKQLENFPFSGQIHPVFTSIREFVIRPNFRVYYFVNTHSKEVTILNIINVRRQN